MYTTHFVFLVRCTGECKSKVADVWYTLLLLGTSAVGNSGDKTTATFSEVNFHYESFQMEEVHKTADS